MARVSQMSPVKCHSGYDELLGSIQGNTSQDVRTGTVRTERARGPSADTTVCYQPEKHDTRPL